MKRAFRLTRRFRTTLLEPASLRPDSSNLIVAQGIINYTETKVFLIPMCNFSTTPRGMLKHMVLATGIAPTPIMLGNGSVENNPGKPSREADSSVIPIYYKPKENRPEQMKRHEKVQSTQTNNANEDWNLEVNLSDN